MTINSTEAVTQPDTTSIPSPSFIVPRRDDLPLRFRGEVLAFKERKSRDNHCYSSVTIYRTETGRYVVLRCFAASFLDRPVHDAFTSSDPAEVICWLRDEDDSLDGVAQDAITIAMDQDPGIERAFGEDVP